MNTRASTPVLFSLIALVALMSTVGCASGVEKRNYQASVQNQSDSPVTVWLTKSGPAVYEANWRSPEDFAIETRSAGEVIAGAVVEPGQTADVGPIMGQFYPGGNAVLRIYYGQHTLSGLLAINYGDPDRKDFELAPGFNGFLIRSEGGALHVDRTTKPDPAGGSTPSAAK